jgi:hypothetical protein
LFPLFSGENTDNRLLYQKRYLKRIICHLFSFFHIKHNLGQKVSKKMRKYFVKATFFME